MHIDHSRILPAPWADKMFELHRMRQLRGISCPNTHRDTWQYHLSPSYMQCCIVSDPESEIPSLSQREAATEAIRRQGRCNIVIGNTAGSFDIKASPGACQALLVLQDFHSFLITSDAGWHRTEYVRRATDSFILRITPGACLPGSAHSTAEPLRLPHHCHGIGWQTHRCLPR